MKFITLINIILNKRFACRLNSPTLLVCLVEEWWKVRPEGGSSPSSLQHSFYHKRPVFQLLELRTNSQLWLTETRPRRMHIRILYAWYLFGMLEVQISFCFHFFYSDSFQSGTDRQPWAMPRKLFPGMGSLGKVCPALHSSCTVVFRVFSHSRTDVRLRCSNLRIGQAGDWGVIWTK